MRSFTRNSSSPYTRPRNGRNNPAPLMQHTQAALGAISDRTNANLLWHRTRNYRKGGKRGGREKREERTAFARKDSNLEFQSQNLT
jgi:hypothetical protein